MMWIQKTYIYLINQITIKLFIKQYNNVFKKKNMIMFE